MLFDLVLAKALVAQCDSQMSDEEWVTAFRAFVDLSDGKPISEETRQKMWAAAIRNKVQVPS